jgi:hypothetical protein
MRKDSIVRNNNAYIYEGRDVGQQVIYYRSKQRKFPNDFKEEMEENKEK